jgi:hypothetical protein
MLPAMPQLAVVPQLRQAAGTLSASGGSAVGNELVIIKKVVI